MRHARCWLLARGSHSTDRANSVDCYPNQCSVAGYFNLQHSWVLPKMGAHQRLVLIPAFYGDGPLVSEQDRLLDCDGHLLGAGSEGRRWGHVALDGVR